MSRGILCRCSADFCLRLHSMLILTRNDSTADSLDKDTLRVPSSFTNGKLAVQSVLLYSGLTEHMLPLLAIPRMILPRGKVDEVAH